MSVTKKKKLKVKKPLATVADVVEIEDKPERGGVKLISHVKIRKLKEAVKRLSAKRVVTTTGVYQFPRFDNSTKEKFAGKFIMSGQRYLRSEGVQYWHLSTDKEIFMSQSEIDTKKTQTEEIAKIAKEEVIKIVEDRLEVEEVEPEEEIEESA